MPILKKGEDFSEKNYTIAAPFHITAKNRGLRGNVKILLFTPGYAALEGRRCHIT
jgi:hypothetical protein